MTSRIVKIENTILYNITACSQIYLSVNKAVIWLLVRLTGIEIRFFKLDLSKKNAKFRIVTVKDWYFYALLNTTTLNTETYAVS